MIILDIKNNIQYNLSALGGTFLAVEFNGGEIETFSKWEPGNIKPVYSENAITWEDAEIKVLLNGASRLQLEKYISYLKSITRRARIYFEEMGFDFFFEGELSGVNIDYKGKTHALVTVEMRGRKLGTRQEINFPMSSETSWRGVARVNFNGNETTPLRIDIDIPANGFPGASIQIVGKDSRGVTLWSENLAFKAFSPSSAGTITLDGEKGVFYFTSNNIRENWVENYKAHMLPFIKPCSTLEVVFLGSLGGQAINVTRAKLSFESRWA